jgi:arabinose-5-phosphate isomerase
LNNLQTQEIAKQVFSIEISELKEISHKINNSFSNAIDFILSSTGKIVIVGVGKSAHVAKKIVATLNSTGSTAQFLHATEAIHGDIGLLEKNDVVICISKSGNTPEIKSILPILKERANGIIAITGNLQSDLAKTANFILDVTVSAEADPNNLAPTSSTTAQLVMGDAVAVALLVKKQFHPEDFAKYHPGGVLGKKLLWKVEDLLHKNEFLPQINPKANLSEVIISISSGKKGITAVIEDKKVIGVITDGDLRRMLEQKKDFQEIKATEIMSHKPKTIQKNQMAMEAMKIIKEEDVGQLIVLDNTEYYGILDIYTLIKEGISD